jgi:hypothetical protein
MSEFGVQVQQGAGTVSYSGRCQGLAGVHAYVDTVGQVRDRAMLTRVVGGAVAAGPVGAVVGALLRKRTDERECLLFITGEQDWVIPIRPSLAPRARSFAAWLNTQASERAGFEQRFAVAAAAGEAERERRATGPRPGVYRHGLR